MQEYVSGTKVEAVRVVECSLWVSPDGPGEAMSSEASIEMGRLVPLPVPADGIAVYSTTVGITAQLVDADGVGTPRARASVRLAGNVAVSADGADPAHSAKVAAAGTMYPQAQAYLAMLASMAQVAGFSTPVVEPEALVRAIDAAARG